MNELDQDQPDFKALRLDELLALEGESVDPRERFVEHMNEENNYIVLTFKTDIDWLAAMDHFKLQSGKMKNGRGKEWSTGIGRVVDGAAYLAEQLKQ